MLHTVLYESGRLGRAVRRASGVAAGRVGPWLRGPWRAGERGAAGRAPRILLLYCTVYPC